uniref:Uncharacterized protein n=1 Tax=Heterorhabditis bacteriophora TaxID=37862 RepID=A0A1I7XNK1_HETBA
MVYKEKRDQTSQFIQGDMENSPRQELI